MSKNKLNNIEEVEVVEKPNYAKNMSSFFKNFQEADNELNFQFASDRLGIKTKVIPTGSFLLNSVIGVGGYPYGRITQLYGPPASGKTLLSMLAIKEAQKIDPTANQMFLDSENTFNTGWANSLGLDVSKIIIVDEDLAVNGRRLFEMLLGKPKEDKQHVLIGKSQDGLLDKIAKKEININLIILDSLGAIIPPIEDVSVVGKSNMAPLPRFLSTTFKKLSLEVSKANIPFIVINHKRDSLDPYGPAHTYAGGNSYSHFLSLCIYVESIARKDAAILDENEDRVGNTLRVVTEKNKLFPFPRKCEFKVNYGIGIIDLHEEVAQLALDNNIVQKPTTVSYEYGNQKWVGNAKYIQAILDDPNLYNELVSKIEEAQNNK